MRGSTPRVWYKKLAVLIIQLALYNAYMLYQCTRGTFLEFPEVVKSSLYLRIGGLGAQVFQEVRPHTLYEGKIFPG